MKITAEGGNELPFQTPRSLTKLDTGMRVPEPSVKKGKPTPPLTWCRRTGHQLKTRATTIKADLGPSPDRESSATTHDGERTG